MNPTPEHHKAPFPGQIMYLVPLDQDQRCAYTSRLLPKGTEVLRATDRRDGSCRYYDREAVEGPFNIRILKVEKFPGKLGLLRATCDIPHFVCRVSQQSLKAGDAFTWDRDEVVKVDPREY